MKKKTLDFIEISIIVLIILLLTTISLLAIQSSRARARDARRVADIRLIQSALALYRHDSGNFPETSVFVAGSPLVYENRIYLDIIPTPPTKSGECGEYSEYRYQRQEVENELTSYTLEYCLGEETANIPSGINTATPSGITIKK